MINQQVFLTRGLLMDAPTKLRYEAGGITGSPYRPGVWTEYAAANETLREELNNALRRFREECAPVVGPELTCRGRVIREARPVPVDPVARFSRRWSEAAEAVGLAWGRIRDSFQQVAAVLKSLDDVQQNDLEQQA